MSDNNNNESSDSSSSSSGRSPFKKPRRFQDKWLQHPHMSTWLRKQEDGRAWCAVCEIHFHFDSCKSLLLRHANSLRHKYNLNKNMDGAGTNSDLEDKLRLARNKTKTMEIKYCLLAIEANSSFERLQEFSKLNKRVIGSKLPSMQSVKLGRTKIRAIIKNVVNKSIVLDVKAIIEEKYFSLIIDESTDIDNIKNLSVLLRFINNDHLETHLLDLIRVKEATAENIFKCVMNSLNKLNLSVSKVVGIGVDNASVMIGCNNSVMTRFQDSNREILQFACLCHSMHLVAVHATNCIPKCIDKLLQDIYGYFTHSPKRVAVLQDIQKIMQIEQRKVLRPSKTRWLAQAACIQKILNLWDTLFTQFALEHLDENLSATSIYSKMTDDLTKPYLEFLNFILTYFNKYNQFFQSHQILIHRLAEDCKKFIRVFGSYFIKQEFLEDDKFERLNVNDPTILLPLENIFIGPEASELIQTLKVNKPEISNQIIEFFKIIQKFFQTAFVESIKRLPYNNEFVEALNFLSPQVALDCNKHVGQIEIIVKQFPCKVIAAKVIRQWFSLAAEPSADEREKLKTLDILKFWCAVSDLKDSSGTLLYDEIAKLAFICLSLPHSNADVERYFSMITDIKSIKRNRLHTHMVCSLTRIKLYLRSKKVDASSFQISDQMLEFFNSDMYNREQIPLELEGVLIPDEIENSNSDAC